MIATAEGIFSGVGGADRSGKNGPEGLTLGARGSGSVPGR